MSNRRKRKPPRAILATGAAGSNLVLASPAEQTVDDAARTISGLVVPFGSAGETSGGRLTFAAGALRVSDPKRVKLLREHDQRDVVGFGTSFEETDAGLVGTFSVPEGPNGDLALAEARNGLRDAFSVGVQLDDNTMTKLRRANGASVAATGQLREVSQVSVPAFDDARVAAATGADLVVSAWSPATTSAAGVGTTTLEGTQMTEEQRRRLAALRAQDTLTQAEAAELSQLAALDVTTGTPAAGQAQAAAGVTTGTPAAGQAQAGVTGPAVVPAVAGAAYVTAEPSTYDFAAGGPSLIVDLFRSRMDADSEAGQRVERFNAELRSGNVASQVAFVTAAATRDDVDGAGTDLPSFFQPNPNRPDLMRQLVDVKRPIISKLDRVPISNAQPFAIPKVGEFTGVGAHTEGTPHRPAGTLTLGGDTVQPTATSGAWEVSRELIDASNPALDRIAARAMLRDYQRQTEGKAVALINARAGQADGNVYGVSTVLQLRAAMLDFVNDDEEAADIALVSKGLLRMLGLDTDTTERPQLPFVSYSPTNAAGAMTAGGTGFSIDGVPVTRAARLDAGVTGANTAGSVGVLARSEGILWAESSVLQFRFDEVLGPGVVKLALWAYSGAAILDTADVAVINSGADPTP